MFRNGTLARSPPTNWLSQNINLQLRKISSHAVPGVRLCRFRKAPRRAANARFCRPAVLQRRDASRFLASSLAWIKRAIALAWAQGCQPASVSCTT